MSWNDTFFSLVLFRRVKLDSMFLWMPFGRFLQNILQGAKESFQWFACEIGALPAAEILPKVFLHFSVLCCSLLNCLERCTDLILISLYKHSVNYSAHIQPGIMSCFHQSSAKILHFKMHSWWSSFQQCEMHIQEEMGIGAHSHYNNSYLGKVFDYAE